MKPEAIIDIQEAPWCSLAKIHRHKKVTPGVYLMKHIDDDGCIYVGSSSDVYRRNAEHRYRLDRGIHKNKKLQAIVNEHGIRAVQWCLYRKCPLEDVINEEDVAIQFFDAMTEGMNEIDARKGAGNRLSKLTATGEKDRLRKKGRKAK